MPVGREPTAHSLASRKAGRGLVHEAPTRPVDLRCAEVSQNTGARVSALALRVTPRLRLRLRRLNLTTGGQRSKLSHDDSFSIRFFRDQSKLWRDPVGSIWKARRSDKTRHRQLRGPRFRPCWWLNMPKIAECAECAQNRAQAALTARQAADQLGHSIVSAPGSAPLISRSPCRSASEITLQPVAVHRGPRRPCRARPPTRRCSSSPSRVRDVGERQGGAATWVRAPLPVVLRSGADNGQTDRAR
jgi:hypothetical protein